MSLVLGTFVGVLALVLGAYWVFVVREEAGAHRALQKRLRPQEEAARRGLTPLAFHGVLSSFACVTGP